MTSETYRCFECDVMTCEFKIYTSDKLGSGGAWYNLRCPLGWKACFKKVDNDRR